MRYCTRASLAMVGVTLALLSCDHSPTMPRLGQLTLDVVSGDGQTAVVGTQLAPLIVKVTSGGNPVAGQILNFRVVSGGGSVYGGTELTDGHGIAQELWTLGTNASQPQKVEVRAVESNTGAEKVFATFAAMALPDKAAKLIAAAGDNQTALAGTRLPLAPAVEVTDQYGNPIAAVQVTFAVATGGGTATGLSQTTNASGIAAVGTWTLGTTAGTNTLTAVTPSLTLSGSPLTFTAVGTTGTAAQLVMVSGNNQLAAPGSTLQNQPTVLVFDANGNGVPNVAVTFTVTSGGGSINGVGSVTTLTGSGTSPGTAAVSWTLGAAPGPNTLQATAVGLSGSPLVFSATGAGLVVTSLADDGSPGTLRQLIATAPGGSTIGFAQTLCAGVSCTIALGSPLSISTTLTIFGPTSYQLVLSGQNAYVVLVVNVGGNVAVSAVTIANGNNNGHGGGGIQVSAGGALTLSNSIVSGNTAAFGGGIFNVGTLTLINTTVSGNYANGAIFGYVNPPSGIFNQGALTLQGTKVCNNTPLPNVSNIGTISGSTNCPDP